MRTHWWSTLIQRVIHHHGLPPPRDSPRVASHRKQVAGAISIQAYRPPSPLHLADAVGLSSGVSCVMVLYHVAVAVIL